MTIPSFSIPVFSFSDVKDFDPGSYQHQSSARQRQRPEWTNDGAVMFQYLMIGVFKYVRVKFSSKVHFWKLNFLSVIILRFKKLKMTTFFNYFFVKCRRLRFWLEEYGWHMEDTGRADFLWYGLYVDIVDTSPPMVVMMMMKFTMPQCHTQGRH